MLSRTFLLQKTESEAAKEIETLYAYQRIISEHQLYLIRATCEHSLILLNHV